VNRSPTPDRGKAAAVFDRGAAGLLIGIVVLTIQVILQPGKVVWGGAPG
jgi:hypothetical protein